MGQPGVFLTATWSDLVMLTYEIEPAVLRPFVPAGTELDTWQGHTLISVVGLLFRGTRLLGVPVPGHRDFEEINLRCYVRRRGPEGWRRGVVFIKEIVPRRAIAAVARLTYNERYVAMPTRFQADAPPDAPTRTLEYGWRLGGRWHRLWATADGPPAALIDGSEAEFITEHYWGYVALRDGGGLEYRVEHPRWRVWQTRASGLEADVAALYGPAFVAALTGTPRSALVAEGSPVVVRRGARLV
jgi:uncharacterized protein